MNDGQVEIDSDGPSLVTERLRLRPWRDADLAPFAALNADPEVMRWFPEPLDRERSDALAARIRRSLRLLGFGLWAVEVPGKAEFIGFVGLSEPGFEAPFMACIEVGWRLARAHWHRGYATEAARAAVAFGFETLGREEIVSFTVVGNAPSRAVMERLGMTHDPAEDFDHPSLSGHPLQRHVLYRLSRQDWRGASGS
jgi:RimJ/RimL family protein N-acetyltransferase